MYIHTYIHLHTYITYVCIHIAQNFDIDKLEKLISQPYMQTAAKRKFGSKSSIFPSRKI